MNQVVYVISSTDVHGLSEVIGVYSTVDKAKDHYSAWKSDWKYVPQLIRWEKWEQGTYFYIDEWEVV